MDKISPDKKYRYKNGDCAILLTTERKHQGRWTVVSMGECGNLNFHDAYGVEKISSDYDLVEVSKWDHIKYGDVVEVRYNTTDYWKLRRFSHIESGLAVAVSETEVGCARWPHCRLVCAQENEEWRRT